MLPGLCSWVLAEGINQPIEIESEPEVETVVPHSEDDERPAESETVENPLGAPE